MYDEPHGGDHQPGQVRYALHDAVLSLLSLTPSEPASARIPSAGPMPA